MRKRILSLVLLICILSSLFPVVAGAEEVLLSAGFETESSLWLGGSLSPDALHDGESGFSLSSPVGGETNAGFANLLEYNASVSLEEGKIYRLSFWAKTSDPASGNRTNSVNVNSNTLNFEIQTIGSEWQFISVSFIAPESRDYGLDLYLYSAVNTPLLYIDSLTLTATESVPASYSLVGRKTLTNPAVGENTYRYRLDALDEDGNRISSPLTEFGVQNLPEGVSFDPFTATVAVSDSAEENASFTLISKIPGQAPLYHTLTLSRSLLVNGNFEDAPLFLGWDDEFTRLHMETEEDNLYLRLSPSEGDEEDSYASLRQENPVTLIGGELYVLRARVRSTDAVPESFLYTRNTSSSSDTTVYIDITGISGDEWQEIYCAIRPEVTGNYEIILNLHTSLYEPIFIDDITLEKEELTPSEIQFSAPGQIARPRDDMEFFPIMYQTLDQEGNPIDGGNLIPTVYPDNGTVILDPENMILAVTPSAILRDYTLTLSTQDGLLSSSLRLTISEEKIGDGSFEEKVSGEWWAAQSPSKLTLTTVSGGQDPTHGNRLAHLDLSGEVTAMLSNSYATYYTDETYVFHIAAQKGYTDVNTVLTAVLANQYGEYTFLASEELSSGDWNEISAVFSPTEPLTGRLILFLSVLSEEMEQWVLLDDVSIEKILVSANNPEIVGNNSVGETLFASYEFVHNFETGNASLIRWHTSDSEYGPFVPLPGNDDTSLYLSPSLAGTFIRFEVIPFSSIGGFIGNSVWSDPIYVISSDLPLDELPTEIPTEIPIPTEAPIVPLPLPENPNESPFADTQGHWAQNEIAMMASAGIITGYEDGSFRPDRKVSRAEFTALLMRALTVTPHSYTGRFTDVDSSCWYADLVETAFMYGFIKGTSETEFSPDEPITREQMAVIIMRVYEVLGGEKLPVIEHAFYDEPEISPWAKQSVLECYALGFVQGTSLSIFSPKGISTRAQSAVILMRLLRSV